MPRSLKGVVLGSIAIAFVYLVFHAREPLRLNIGDPWSDANVLTSINYVRDYGFLATSFTDILDVGPLTEDSYRYIHYPPGSEIFYGAVAKYLGVSDIGTFRLFALAFSSLAMWLLFSYVRRMHSDRIALIATALFSTSLLWLMYADSMHQAPIMQCSCFLALWGLVRAIETRQRRHYAAALLGSYMCFFTSYDYFVFLPAAVLVTVYAKLGNPFARRGRPFVALCALGCALGIAVKCATVIGAVGWQEFVADLHVQFVERATAAHDRMFTSAIPTMLRRITMVLTPLFWVTAGFHVIRAVRAPSLGAAFRGTGLWMLAAALVFLDLFSQLAASQMLASQVLLPYYAIGSALVIDRLLDDRRRLLRGLGFAWLVAAPLWSFFFMFSHPRSVLDREDVARTRAYLAANDHNDFVMSNLVSDGHIQAAFERHNWGAPDDASYTSAPRQLMRVFGVTGATYVHLIIFNDPDSRFIDKALWPLGVRRQQWSITGWPHIFRSKANQWIAEYDRRVHKNLGAARAVVVQQATNYAVYRIDRDAVLQILGETIPVTDRIDLTSLTSWRHALPGWRGPELLDDGTAASSTESFAWCPQERCATVLTKLGLAVKHEETIRGGQLMFRLDRVCDLQLSVAFARPAHARLAIHGFSSEPIQGTSATVTIPARHLVAGINVLAIENLTPVITSARLYVSSLELRPACAAP